MSKIICDVCGTAYPETAAQCPICGCVRSTEPKTVAGNTNDVDTQATGTYTYVKGGRFSKKNVKKRNQETGSFTGDAGASAREYEQSGNNGEKGLTIAIIALLLAIAAVVIYIILNFFAPFGNRGDHTITPSTTESTTTLPDETTLPTTEPTIPCTDLTVDTEEITLDALDATYTLEVTASPADTTDFISYESSDESVVTVDADGVITAVAEGEAVITITCGDVEIECKVVCAFEPDETEPPTEPAIDFELNREDFSMFFKGDSWVLYNGEIPRSEINWRSSDESVATVSQGKVVAVGPGYAYIYAEYDGVERKCIVHCQFKNQ